MEYSKKMHIKVTHAQKLLVGFCHIYKYPTMRIKWVMQIFGSGFIKGDSNIYSMTFT